MIQAIQTRYLGPTNSRGSRVKAFANAGSVTVSWDYALNQDENHNAAAKALVAKLGWIPSQGGAFDSAWVGGSLKDGNVYVLACDGAQSFRVEG